MSSFVSDLKLPVVGFKYGSFLLHAQNDGLMGARQSYVRCSKLKREPQHRFQLFETIQSIWRKSLKSKVPLLEFFYEEITALQKAVAVKKVDPISGEESQDKVLNMVRHTLEHDWPIWKVAIQKSFEFQVEIERAPFLFVRTSQKFKETPEHLPGLS